MSLFTMLRKSNAVTLDLRKRLVLTTNYLNCYPLQFDGIAILLEQIKEFWIVDCRKQAESWYQGLLASDYY